MLKSEERVELITSAADLSAKLGEDFVLFVGSAISGFAPPRLPMGDAVKYGIVGLLPSKLSSGIYSDQLYSKYAEQLVIENGSYRNLLKSTKFEEFLWLVSKASSREALDDLLDKLYTCDRKQYGPNHIAIASLLRSERCKACFTTNFDNAIELACQDIGLGLDKYVEPGKYPTTLPRRGEKPLLIKMHGSAPEKNCVAQSTMLLAAQSEETHGSLKDLLAGQRVLVLGYSGLGDIDISPHLNTTEATFFWANHQHPKPGELPGWADYLILLDLAYPPPSSLSNLLLELANTDVSQGRVFINHEGAGSILKEWMKRTNLNAKLLVRSLYEWRRTDPILHLYHEESAEGGQVIRFRRYGWACIQRRAYRTAFEVFNRALKSEGLTIEDELHLIQGQGFALWRMGRWEESRAVLESLINRVAQKLAIKSDLKGQPMKDLLSDIYRNYLEVSRDLLQIMPPKKRLQKATQWKLDDAFHCLDRLPHSSPQNQILATLVERHIDWLLDKKVTVTEIKTLCETCLNSTYPTTAWAVVSLLLQMSIREGWKFYRIVHSNLKKAGITHYLRKNQESLVLASLRWLIRPLGIKGYNAAKLMIKWYYEFRTRFDEQQYKKQSKEWTKWRLGWITSRKVRTVV